jgi:hypothetical protein
MELASNQLRGICELHSDDLSKWLAQSSLSDRKDRGLISRTLQEQEVVLAAGSSSGVDAPLPVHPPATDGAPFTYAAPLADGAPFGFLLGEGEEHIVEFLNHIGRIDTDLVYLAKLAEIGESCGWQARKEHANALRRVRGMNASLQPSLTAGVFPAVGVSDFFAQLVNDSETYHSPPAKCAKMIGTWEMCDRQQVR